jgi:hypothetical protein
MPSQTQLRESLSSIPLTRPDSVCTGWAQKFSEYEIDGKRTSPNNMQLMAMPYPTGNLLISRPPFACKVSLNLTPESRF